jgi:hypothetical protein
LRREREEDTREIQKRYRDHPLAQGSIVCLNQPYDYYIPGSSTRLSDVAEIKSHGYPSRLSKEALKSRDGGLGGAAGNVIAPKYLQTRVSVICGGGPGIAGILLTLYVRGSTAFYFLSSRLSIVCTLAGMREDVEQEFDGRISRVGWGRYRKVGF